MSPYADSHVAFLGEQIPLKLADNDKKGGGGKGVEAANAADDGRCLGAQNAAQKSARPNPRKGGGCKVGGDERRRKRATTGESVDFA